MNLWIKIHLGHHKMIFAWTNKLVKVHVDLVELRGLEPLTPTLPVWCGQYL
jgi:hypothetical protein